MRLFGVVNGSLDRNDFAQWVTLPFVVRQATGPSTFTRRGDTQMTYHRGAATEETYARQAAAEETYRR